MIRGGRMKIAILEDNIYFQNKLLDLLCHEIDLIHVYSNIESYDSSNIVYDLLLLDINLNKANGMNYIKNNESKQLFIIYISNHEEFMIDAFNVNVLGFIPKSRIDSLLLPKIELARTRLQKTKMISLSIVGEKICVRECDIIMFYMEEGNIYILLENKNRYRLTYATLKEILQFLPDHFLRVNNSCLINVYKISRLNIEERFVVLTNGKKIEVSRRRWKTVKSKYISSRMGELYEKEI